MPPRKRAKVSAASTPQDTTTSTEPPSVEKPTATTDDILNDPWTDDEYTELFKAMIRWKPTGMHKHLRMLSIASTLQSHGYAYNASSGPHTRIPGIWAKLRSLYDLEALDERENIHAGNATPDPTAHSNDDDAMDVDGEEAEENGPGWTEFGLDEDEFGEMMWERRFEKDGGERRRALRDRDSSPEVIEGLNRTRYIPGARLSAAETEDTASTKGKGKKSAAVIAAAKGKKGAVATPAEESKDEDEEDEDEEEDESTPAGSPPAKAATKAAKKGRVTSGSRRSKRKR